MFLLVALYSAALRLGLRLVWQLGLVKVLGSALDLSRNWGLLALRDLVQLGVEGKVLFLGCVVF